MCVVFCPVPVRLRFYEGEILRKEGKKRIPEKESPQRLRRKGGKGRGCHAAFASSSLPRSVGQSCHTERRRRRRWEGRIYILLLVPLLHEPFLPPFLSKHARTISTITPPHFLSRKRERRRKVQRMENLVWWRPQLTFSFWGAKRERSEGEEEGCLWGKAGGIVGRGKKKDIFPSSFFSSIAIFFFEAASSSRYPRRLLTHQRGGGKAEGGRLDTSGENRTRKRTKGKGSGAEAAKLHFLYLETKKVKLSEIIFSSISSNLCLSSNRHKIRLVPWTGNRHFLAVATLSCPPLFLP